MNRKLVTGSLVAVLCICLVILLLIGYYWYFVFPMSPAEFENLQERIAKPIFPPANYTNLLERLKNLDYKFIQVRDYNSSLTGKICVIVHDVDYRWQGAEILSNIERDFGIKSSFFLRVDANYYKNNTPISFFKDLEQHGWEIGIHYDTLSRNHGDQQAALSQFITQVSLIRQTFNVSDSRYHGDQYNNQIVNSWLYGNHTQVWQDLRLREASSTCREGLFEGWDYISDSSKTLPKPQQLGEFGDHLLINLHTDYW